MFRCGRFGQFLVALPFLAAVLALAGGCGPAPKVKGKVAGSVVYKGKAVTDGEVTFLSKDGTGGTTKIEDSGNFAFTTPLEVGTYKVSVGPKPPGQEGPPGAGKVPKAAPSVVPQKYRELATTDLSVTVAEGENNFKIELKD